MLDGSSRSHFDKSVRLCSIDGRPIQLTAVVYRGSEPRWLKFFGVQSDNQAEQTQVNGLCQDVTDLHTQERELHETRWILQSIFDHMPAVVYSKSADGFFTFANPKFYEVCPGASPSALGRHSIDIFPPATAAEHMANDTEIIQTGKTLHSIEHVPQNDGSIAYFDSYKFPSYDSEGRIVGVTGISIDITEKKQMQYDLDRQRAQGLHQARLASIGELAAGVGHEINNPLTIVMSYLNQIESNMASTNPASESDQEKQHQQNLAMIAKARKASERIRIIVGGLRTFARSSQDSKQRLSIVRAVSSSVNLVKEIFAKEGIELSFFPPQQALFAYGDEGQLQQVLMNLLANARDAVLTSAQKQIRIDVRQTQGISISVTDTGPGIAPEVAARIFDPFFTTKSMTHGTGLGLSIAQSIIKDHGGELSFENHYPQGSRFQIDLPQASLDTSDIEAGSEPSINPPETPITAATSESTGKTKKKSLARILIADDEIDIVDILTILLQKMGFEVVGVVNGKEALEKVRAEQFDVLITDMNMPLIKGNELIRKIRHELGNKDLKIFIVTGGINLNLDSSDSELNGLIDGHFYKPFDPQILKTSLFTILGL